MRPNRAALIPIQTRRRPALVLGVAGVRPLELGIRGRLPHDLDPLAERIDHIETPHRVVYDDGKREAEQ